MSSIESKRVQYRKYLERAGVIDALSKALIKLYEEQNKPDDAIRFVRKFMCESCPDDDQFDVMRADLEHANAKIITLEQDIERLKSQIKLTPEEIAEILEEKFKALTEDEENSSSLLRKYLTREVLDELMALMTPIPNESSLLDCIKSGMEYHNSSCGVYAADGDCYDTFKKLFDPIIKDYHGQLENESEALQPDADFGNVADIDNLDPERKYILSTRIRIARNLEGYPYFPKLREKQYVDIEEKVKLAAEVMEGEHMGEYKKMADLEPETQLEMVNEHILFARGDPFLETAGCYRFWPTGRGIFRNPAKTFLIWVNEEDHLRIISMAPCGDLADVYSRIVRGLEKLETNLKFARHARYGNLTACPTNLGTTLRASVHIRLPLLAKDGERLKKMATDLNLQIRGTGGEHTEIVDGVMDISNKRRMGATEFDLVKGMQDGIVELIKAEEELEGGGGGTDDGDEKKDENQEDKADDKKDDEKKD